jgi:3'-5' exoribonuclease
MNKQIYVKDIEREHEEVNDFFVVTRKAIFSTRNNTKYMSLGLRDKTGTIEGKIWERVDELNDLFDRNDLVYITSRTRLYQDKRQLNVTTIRKVEEGLSLEDMRAFLPESEDGQEVLKERYLTLTRDIKDPSIRSLFSVLKRRGTMTERLMFYPASIGVHHMYLGGLLEHSLSVARMALEAVHVVGGEPDVVLAGSLLHDIGKIDEISVKNGFKYSDRGRLLGHITLGVMILDDLIGEVDGFPEEVEDVLKHIIISHHGVEEWGSPRKPMCVEALIVHYMDNLDAKVMGVREYMKDNMEDSAWTTYHKLYESRFYKLPER